MLLVPLFRRASLAALLTPSLLVSALLAASDPRAIMAGATDPAPTPAKPAFTLESIAASRAALQQEIATTRAELMSRAEGASAGTTRALAEETVLLERLDAIYVEQQRTAQQGLDLGKEAADIEERARNRRPPEATFQPPYDLALLDRLYAERDALRQADVSLTRDLGDAEELLKESRDALEEKDRERRAVRAAVAASSATAPAAGNLRLAELESRNAQAMVVFRENALKVLRRQQSLLEPKQKLLLPRFDWLRANLSLNAEDARVGPQKQQERAAELEQAIAVARKEAERTAEVVVATEKRAMMEKIAGELESRRAGRQTATLMLAVLTAQQTRLTEEGGIVEQRRRVLGGEMSTKELRAAAEPNQSALEQLVRARRRETTELFRARRELQDTHARLARIAATDEKAPGWELERVNRLAASIALIEGEVAELDRLKLQRSRLQEEIGVRVTLFSWSDLGARVKEWALAAWNYEVFSVKDEPVRAKTILSVLALIIFGYHASRRLSGVLSRVMFRRAHLDIGRRAAWQALWFYALFVVVLVMAFDLFHISFTQFSVVSGALAVGIGFGSQNLISNFISGIILLIERPVNQGDVIEIDGRQVTVERLGARSTIVRTKDNTHLIVPNNRLLEQPVLNWTLSDDVVRKHLRVGVAYDSPTRRVAELLQGVMVNLEAVRKEPAPIVKFADFGESALIFELYFWIGLAADDAAESDVRHRIAEVFAQEKIVMAFPQRDVHLETSKPLQVVITRPDGVAEAVVRPASPARSEQ